MRVILKILSAFIIILMVLSLLLLKTVDRSSYQEQDFYQQTSSLLDSIQNGKISISTGDTLLVGWSRTDITPNKKVPLAGYGARDPMVMQNIHDSVSISGYVINNGSTKKAILTAELLIIHPAVTLRFQELLKDTDWKPADIYLTATHTHSSVGAWAPGFVGNLFSGNYDPEMVEFLAQKLNETLIRAEKNVKPGNFGYAALSLPDLVKNRLIRDIGRKDPWAKMLVFESDTLEAMHVSYSAHATCLSYNFSELSGDYPSALVDYIEREKIADFASFGAGPMASMGPADTDSREWEKALEIGTRLGENLSLLKVLGVPADDSLAIRSFDVKMELREPTFKISKNIALRSWVFKKVFGQYDSKLSVLQMNNVLLIGTPCDFSGELALDLYEYAEAKGLHLIINSFNGGYIGYIPDDRWYDREKYETRTMSWYGHDNGAYFSEVMRRIIDICVE